MNVKSFAPEDVIIHPELRARKGPPKLENVQKLAESMAQDGQVEPGVVREDEHKKDKVHLVAGEHRLEAVKLLNTGLAKGEEPMRFQAVVIKADDKLASIRAGIENELRVATDIFDRAVLVQNLVQFGLSQAEIGRRFGWSESTVSRTLRAAKLPVKLMKMVQNGDMEEDAAMELAADDKLDKVLMEEVMEEAIRHRNAYEEIKQRKAKEAEERAKAAAKEAEEEKEPKKKAEAKKKAAVAKKKAADTRKVANKPSRISKEDVQAAKQAKQLGEPTPLSRKSFFVIMEAVGKDRDNPIPTSAKNLLGKIEAILDGEYSNPDTVLRNSLLKNCIPD